MINKKGQELSTSTIILIILAIAVLVVLALGFGLGWQKIFPFLSSNNVDTVKAACGIACSSGATYDFCKIERDVNDGTNKLKATCYDLANLEAYADYKIAKCASISCSTA